MLKVYNKKEGERDLYLKLTEEKSGIYLRVVDKNGIPTVGGNLIYIEPDTKYFSLCHGINRDLGFNLDSEGRLKIE